MEEPWSNDACLGYALLAADLLGYSENEVSKLLIEMHRQFDYKTVKEAAEVFRNS